MSRTQVGVREHAWLSCRQRVAPVDPRLWCCGSQSLCAPRLLIAVRADSIGGGVQRAVLAAVERGRVKSEALIRHGANRMPP